MISAIQPLVEIKGTGKYAPPPPSEADRTYRGMYLVLCRDCGDVTREESNYTVPEEHGVRITQAGLYRQRHLSRHLTALANEFAEATR